MFLRLKPLIKGIILSIKYMTLQPLRFEIATSKRFVSYDDFFLICAIKHEAHLLEKAVKNSYSPNRGLQRYDKVKLLIEETKSRDSDFGEVIDWAASVVEKFELWQLNKEPVLSEHPADFSVPEFYTKSVRFWRKDMPPLEEITRCVIAGQLAPASCNRQAFLVRILKNTESEHVGSVGSSNPNMFLAAPYRIFLYVNLNCYSEKFSHFIDVGLFAQNVLLQAKKEGLGTCCCYASEHLDRGQKHWRTIFNLSSQYYCALTILVGYGDENPKKPPRLPTGLITKVQTNSRSL